MIRLRWDRDIFATRSLAVGPVEVYSTVPVNGWGQPLPRILVLRAAGRRLTFERERPRP